MQSSLNIVDKSCILSHLGAMALQLKPHERYPYPDWFKEEIRKAFLQGLKIAEISRCTKVSHITLRHWLNSHCKKDGDVVAFHAVKVIDTPSRQSLSAVSSSPGVVLSIGKFLSLRLPCEPSLETAADLVALLVRRLG